MGIDSHKRSTHILRLSIIIAVYVLSFCLPVYMRDGSPDYNTSGVIILTSLVSNPMYPVGIPALMINACFCLAAFLAFHRLWAAAIGFAVLALFCAGVVVPYCMTPFNEDPRLSLGSGYYTWLLSMSLLLIDSIFQEIASVMTQLASPCSDCTDDPQE